jgi:hypothetical protein
LQSNPRLWGIVMQKDLTLLDLSFFYIKKLIRGIARVNVTSLIKNGSFIYIYIYIYIYRNSNAS